MSKKSCARLVVTLGLLLLFVLFTVAVQTVDVQAIGPMGSSVGFATLNGAFSRWVGTHFFLYEITDWMGVLAFPIGLTYFMVGLVQLIRRKNLWKVDSNILALGLFYVLVLGAYLTFEFWVINRRPVLIDGMLEASYPSSTTLLAMCVFGTSIFQTQKYIKNNGIRTVVCVISLAFTGFLVVGRLFSGVHWFTDIVGGVLLSVCLISFYVFFEGIFRKN